MTTLAKPSQTDQPDHIYVPKAEYLEMLREQYHPSQWEIAVERPMAGAEIAPLPFKQTGDFNRFSHALDDNLRHRFGFSLELSPGTFIIDEEIAPLGRDELRRTYTEVGVLTEDFTGLADELERFPTGTTAMRLLVFEIRGASTNAEFLLIQR